MTTTPLSGSPVTSGAYGSSYAATYAFDGDTNTFFAAAATDSYVGIDLGSGHTSSLIDIRYYPRQGYESRMEDGVFQGANTSDFSGAVTLASIGPSVPPGGQWNTLTVSNPGHYQYFRYYSPDNYADVAELTFDAPTHTAAPSTPTSFRVGSATDTSLTLNWSEPANEADNFEIERSSDGVNFAQIAQVAGSSTGYVDANLPPSASYSYRVRATNSIGDSSFTGSANGTTLALQIPSVPTSLAAITPNAGEINLTWLSSAEDASGYVVERSTDGVNFTSLGTVAATARTFDDTSITSNTNYYYRVKAVNAAGSSTYASLSSPVAAELQNVSWVGASTGGSWDTASNWSTGVVPGLFSNAVIGGIAPISFNVGTNDVYEVTINTATTITGGSLAVHKTANLNAILTLQGGTLSGADVVSSTSGGSWLQLTGGTLDHVTLDTDASLSNGVNIENGLVDDAVLTIGSTINGGTIEFSGTQTLSGTGEVELTGSSALVIYPSADGTPATLTIASGFTVEGEGQIQAYGQDSIVNEGIISATVADQNLQLYGSLINNGTLAAAGGILSTPVYDSVWTNNGIIATSAEGVLNLAGIWTNNGVFDYSSGTVELTGTLDNSNSTLNLGADTGVWTLADGGTIKNGTVNSASAGTWIVVSNGGLDGVTLDVATAIDGSLLIQNGLVNNAIIIVGSETTTGYITLEGTQSLLGNGAWELGSGTGFNVANGDDGTPANVTIGSNQSLTGTLVMSGGSDATLVNQGTIISSITGTQSTFYLAVANNGTITAENGANLLFSGGITIAAGAALESDGGTISLQSTWSNTGAITLNNGTLNLGGTFATANLGTIANTGGNINIVGSLDNSNSTLNLGANGVWNLQNSGEIQGGTITGASGGPWLQLSGGTLDHVTLDTDATLSNGGVNIEDGLVENGVLTVGSVTYGGSLYFRGTQTLSGTGEIALTGNNYIETVASAGESLATLTIASGFTVEGEGEIQAFGQATLVNEGSILANAANQTLTLVGSITDYGTLATSANGSLYVSGDGSIGASGNLSAAGNGNITILGNWTNSGAINVASSSKLNVNTGSDSYSFTNSGSMTVGGVSSIYGAVHNDHIIAIQSNGTLNVNSLGLNIDSIWQGANPSGSFYNTGNIAVSAGGVGNLQTMNANSGEIALNDTAQIYVNAVGTRGSVSAISGTELAVAWSGLMASSGTYHMLARSTDGSNFTNTGSPNSGDYMYDESGLSRDSTYTMRMTTTNSSGGSVVYTAAPQTTFDEIDTSGWYKVSDVVASTGAPLNSFGNWTLNTQWQFAGSAAGVLVHVFSGLVTDGFAPRIPLPHLQSSPGAAPHAVLQNDDTNGDSTNDPVLTLVTGGDAGNDLYTWWPSYYAQAQSAPNLYLPYYPNIAQRNPNAGSPKTPSDPIRYFDGAVVYSATDLQSDALNSPFSQTRSWTSLGQFVTNGQKNGSGMIDTSLPSLSQLNGDASIGVVTSGTEVITFNLINGQYVPASYVPDTLVHADGQFVFTDTAGNQTFFSDFSDATVPEGQFQYSLNAAGVTTAYVYSTDNAGDITEIRRQDSSGNDVESWLYTYLPSSNANAGLLANVQLRHPDGTGGWTIAKQVIYAYYDGSESYGSLGDLKTATTEDPSGAAVDTDYYRYYIPGEADGYTNGLKYVFDSYSYARLVAAVGDPTLAADSAVSAFATHYFQYDDVRRVTLHTVQDAGGSDNGGDGTFTYQYFTSNNPDGTNSWQYKTIETLPDGNQNIVYCNSEGEEMLNVFKDIQDQANPALDGEEWDTFYAYDSDGRPVVEANPSAVTGYNESYADLLHDVGGNYQFIADHSGSLTIDSYYSNTTATENAGGGAKGYLASTSVANGEFGDLTLEASYTYLNHIAGNVVVNPIATDNVYRNGGGGGEETTSYAYTWLDDSAQAQSTIVSAPSVSADQNGSATPDVTTTVFDAYGQAIWTKDADGNLNYDSYNVETGSLLKMIQDVNTAITGDFTGLPNGWTTPAGAGLNLVTAYEVDGLGRDTKETDADGNITYTVYNDPQHETRIYTGWDPSNLTTTGPIQILRDDLPGSYTESLTISTPPHTTNGVPDGTEAIANVQSLSRNEYNNSDQLIGTENYFNLAGFTYSSAPSLGTAGTNYNTITYGYDATGKQSRTVDGTGTITDVTYDGLGRETGVYVGTNDSTTDGRLWTLGTAASSSNMVEVANDTYDNGGVGDSDLTAEALVPGGGAANQIIQYDYDWRDRLVATKVGASPSGISTETDGVNRPITINVYDNLGEVTAKYTVDGDGISMADTNGDGVPDALASDLITPGDNVSVSGLVAFSTASYDNQGRLYESTVYSINGNGTISSSGIKSDTWYDANGNVVETHTSGGAFTKTIYDGASRPTTTYTTDGGAVNANGDANITWAAASSIANDIVLTQTQVIYNANGNVIETITSDRDDTDANVTGALVGPTTTGQPPAGFPSTLTLPADSSPTGSEITLHWIADISLGDGNTYGGGYVSNVSLSWDTTLSVGAIGVWVLPPSTAKAVGFTGTYWAFDVKGESTRPIYLKGEYSTVTMSPLVFTDPTNEHATGSVSDDEYNIEEIDAEESPVANARTSYTATYYDAANRETASVNVGTNGGTTWTRPSSAPSDSNITLVTTTAYNAAGEVDHTIDPNQGLSNTTQETRYFYDSLGRVLYSVAAWNGTYDPTAGARPPSSTVNADQTTAYTYDGDGHTLTMTAVMPSGQSNQTTIYNYGVITSQGSTVNSNDLLRLVQYPDPNTGQASTVASGQNSFTYNTLGQTLTKTDQNGTTHTYTYDSLGRQVLDSITTTTASTPTPPTIGDGGFENYGDGQPYNTTGTPWTFYGNSGDVGLGAFAPATGHDGNQYAFLQSNPDQSSTAGTGVNGAISQSVDFTSTGEFQISFLASQRDWGDGPQDQIIQVSVDGTVVGTFQPTSSTMATFTTSRFTIGSTGDHTIRFAAMLPASDGDNTAMIDDVGIEGVTTGANVDTSVQSIGTTYNSQGLVDTQTSYSTTTANPADIVNQIKDLYNGLGQLTQQFQEHAGAVSNSTLSVQYAYSDPTTGGLLTSMTYPSGETINYSYGANGTLNNAIGRLDSLSENTANGTRTLETYSYLGLSTVVVRAQPQANMELTYETSGLTYGDGGDMYTGLDRFGRVVDQKWIDPITNTTIDDYTYTYDANGNVVSKNNVLDSAFNETYTYDDLDQLANMTRGGSAYQSWDTDALGNMDSVTTGGTTVDETHANNNELTSLGNATLGYDNNGNTLLDDQGHHLVYDAWNRLVEVKDSGGTPIESYAYDALGHRITETPATGNPDDLYYSSQWQVIEEDIASSGMKLHADYVWSPVFVDALVLRDEHLNATYDGTSFAYQDRVYAVQDANYNTTALVGDLHLQADANGDGQVNVLDLARLAGNYGAYVTGGAADGDFNGDGIVNGADFGILTTYYNNSWDVAERFVYDAYGKSQALTKTWTATTDAYGWQYKYQGGRYDATTGLYDFRNREYSPTMMRWMTQDPMGYVDGLNDYGFVRASPLNYVDPLGLDMISVYRRGEFPRPSENWGGNNVGSQWWAHDNPLTNPAFSQEMGLPWGNSSPSPDWVATGSADDAGWLGYGPAAPSPDAPLFNPGGGLELTVCPDDIRLETFHTPPPENEGVPSGPRSASPNDVDPLIRNADPPNGWKPDPETLAGLPEGPAVPTNGEPMEPGEDGIGSGSAGAEGAAETAEEEELLELLVEGILGGA